ncbi:alpha/beta hydrolase [Rummeliibacillus pycnus]|uniref:alpha/beta hydrolase n=1 Tax=Rummeliibacillus pycnus TaxID=101070 RepID=UPI003D2867DC
MKIGVLCLHGFTGGAYEIKAFSDYLEQYTEWKIYVPILSGHGEKLNLDLFTAEHWLMDAEIAYKRLFKEVDEIFIIGFSMGGIIAMYLALRYKVKALVLLSPAARYIRTMQFVTDLNGLFMDFMHGDHKENEFFKLYERKVIDVPIASAKEFTRLVHKMSPYYEKITVPVCLVQGEKDELVPYTTADFLYNKIASKKKELITTPDGKHLICYCEDAEKWFKKALDFLNNCV